MSSDWDEKAAWMRKHGIQSAQWDAGGTLLAAIAGPPPETPGEPLSLDAFKAQLEEQKQKAQEQLDMLDFGAS